MARGGLAGRARTTGTALCSAVQCLSYAALPAVGCIHFKQKGETHKDKGESACVSSFPRSFLAFHDSKKAPTTDDACLRQSGLYALLEEECPNASTNAIK